ncbi:MAG: hypothetical protein ACYC97_12410 [Metallibacterium sp.]
MKIIIKKEALKTKLKIKIILINDKAKKFSALSLGTIKNEIGHSGRVQLLEKYYRNINEKEFNFSIETKSIEKRKAFEIEKMNEIKKEMNKIKKEMILKTKKFISETKKENEEISKKNEIKSKEISKNKSANIKAFANLDFENADEKFLLNEFGRPFKRNKIIDRSTKFGCFLTAEISYTEYQKYHGALETTGKFALQGIDEGQRWNIFFRNDYFVGERGFDMTCIDAMSEIYQNKIDDSWEHQGEIFFKKINDNIDINNDNENINIELELGRHYLNGVGIVAKDATNENIRKIVLKTSGATISHPEHKTKNLVAGEYVILYRQNAD